MSSLFQVIFFSLIGGIFSLIGGMFLLAGEKRAKNVAKYATPFAAGALLAAAFIDLLSEANHEGDIEKALIFTLVGILVFFLLERFLRWFHHHHEDDNKHSHPDISLIVIGDTLHNFIDGIAIAAGFLVSPSTGIVVTLAVAAHEIPQEIGDFGLLLNKGMKKSKILQVNFISALATTLAAVIFFQVGSTSSVPLDIVLGLVAGFFIYIAVSDIIPSIHKNEEKVIAGPQTLLLIIGVLMVGVTTTYLHKYIEQDSEHTHTHESVQREDHVDNEDSNKELIEHQNSSHNAEEHYEGMKH